jgi:uncharacterized protein (UPF0147 family)
MSMEKEIEHVMRALTELQEDNTVPRNVKNKVQRVMQILQEKEELSIRINKALNELDEVADDANLQPYTRTQIWNIVSLLEMV